MSQWKHILLAYRELLFTIKWIDKREETLISFLYSPETRVRFEQAFPQNLLLLDSSLLFFQYYHAFHFSHFSFSDASCISPPDIPNAVKISSGQQNGSLTVYSCLYGYKASNEYNTIVCNGSHWTSTNFSCSQGETSSFFVREWFNNILRSLYSLTYYLLHVGSKIDICCMKDLITFLPKLIL